VILEDFAARPHSSGANIQKQGKQSSRALERPRVSREIALPPKKILNR
jgi:hypothetical protein